jgi:hypothetical protein
VSGVAGRDYCVVDMPALIRAAELRETEARIAVGKLLGLGPRPLWQEVRDRLIAARRSA